MERQLHEQLKSQKRAFHASKTETIQRERLTGIPRGEAGDHYTMQEYQEQFPKHKRVAMVEKVPAHLRNKYGTNNPVN